MTRQTLNLSEPMRDYFLQETLREPAELARLRTRTAAHRVAKMTLAPEQGALLVFLLRLIGAQRYIEVGAFLGYSATAAAIAMGPQGQVVSCDICEEFTLEARKNWQEAGVAGQIQLHLGPALASLQTLLANGAADQFDCMLIDADKPNYPNYYELALQLVRPRGLIILDNMFLGGRVANPQPSHPRSVAIMNTFNRQLRDDARVEHCILPAGDGMTLLFKR